MARRHHLTRRERRQARELKMGVGMMFDLENLEVHHDAGNTVGNDTVYDAGNDTGNDTGDPNALESYAEWAAETARRVAGEDLPRVPFAN